MIFFEPSVNCFLGGRTGVGGRVGRRNVHYFLYKKRLVRISCYLNYSL